MGNEYVLTQLSDLQDMANAVRSSTGSTQLFTVSDLRASIVNELYGNVTTGIRVFSTTDFYINDVKYTQSKEGPVGLYPFDSNSVLIIRDSTNTKIITTVVVPHQKVLSIAIPNSFHTAGSDAVPVFDKETIAACIKYDVHDTCLPLGSQFLFNDSYTSYNTVEFASVDSYSSGTQAQIPRITNEKAIWENMTCEHQAMFNGSNLYLIMRGSNFGTEGTAEFTIALIDQVVEPSDYSRSYDNFLSEIVDSSSWSSRRLFKEKTAFTAETQAQYGIELYNTITGNIDLSVTKTSCRLYNISMSAYTQSLYATLVGHDIDKNNKNQSVPVTFMIDVPLKQSINITDTNLGGYGASNFYTVQLPLLKNRLIDVSTASYLTTLRKSYWKTANSSAATQAEKIATYEKIDDVLILPSELELFNSHYAGGSAGLNQEGQHYPFFDTTESLSFNFEKFNNKIYWTRSTTNGTLLYDSSTGEQIYFVGFDGLSKSSYYKASTKQYIRLLLGFKPAVELFMEEE